MKPTIRFGCKISIIDDSRDEEIAQGAFGVHKSPTPGQGPTTGSFSAGAALLFSTQGPVSASGRYGVHRESDLPTTDRLAAVDGGGHRWICGFFELPNFGLDQLRKARAVSSE